MRAGRHQGRKGFFTKRDFVSVAKQDEDICPAGERAIRRFTTVEHVVGTLKRRTGSAHFPTRTLGRVTTEMSLQVLAYNLKRVSRLLGVARTMKAMRTVGS